LFRHARLWFYHPANLCDKTGHTQAVAHAADEPSTADRPEPVIDLHAHVLPWELLRRLAAEYPQVAPKPRASDDRWYFDYPNGHAVGPLPQGVFDLAVRLGDMDAQRVDVQALSIVPSHFFYELGAGLAGELAAVHNDALRAEARSAPDRFVVLAGLPLQDSGAAVAEVDRLAPDPLVVGVQIGSHVAGANLDDPALRPVWRALEEAGLAVVVHPHRPAGAERLRQHYLVNLVGFPSETTVAAAALLFGGVAADHSGLRFCLLHGGGFLPYQIGRLDHGWEIRPELRERLPVPPSSVADRFYYDSLTHGTAALRHLVGQVGGAQVFLGSDYPFDMGATDPVGDVEAIGTTDPEAAHRILRTTPGSLTKR
jgi:aminocarboxymuconate-semialdehyde decarboxylase